jgi:tetratricopeptide (TPR) repeat protein
MPEPPEPPRKIVLARNLEEAPRGSLVYVDRKGKVRSPARYRALMATSYGLLVATVGGASALWISMIGVVPGLALGLGFTGWAAWMLRSNFQLRTGMQLLLSERMDEAIPHFERASRARFTPGVSKALAMQNLGAAYAWKGELETALRYQRRAIKQYGRSRSGKRLHAKLVRYAEISTLANLDRAEDARQRFESLPVPGDDSDYLRVLHWGAELQVCMAEGHCPLSEDDIHARAIVALRITTAGPLIALLAWAHRENGDDDQAWHLLREAYDREHTPGLTAAQPRLWAWMEANKAAAGVGPYRSE